VREVLGSILINKYRSWCTLTFLKCDKKGKLCHNATLSHHLTVTFSATLPLKRKGAPFIHNHALICHLVYYTFARWMGRLPYVVTILSQPPDGANYYSISWNTNKTKWTSYFLSKHHGVFSVLRAISLYTTVIYH